MHHTEPNTNTEFRFLSLYFVLEQTHEQNYVKMSVSVSIVVSTVACVLSECKQLRTKFDAYHYIASAH